MKKILSALILLTSCSAAFSQINVVAAENQYANVAQMIGGEYVNAVSVNNNPTGNPHLFATSAKESIKVADADVVIYNGSDYDAWMEKIINANNLPIDSDIIINVSKLMNIPQTGDRVNPHVWFAPDAFLILATNLTELFQRIDPDNKQYYEANLSDFKQKYQTIKNKVAAIKSEFSGVKVTATEPVYNYMINALGLQSEGLDFQWSKMNGASLSPSVIIKYNDLFENRIVKVLFYNSQVTDNSTKNAERLANDNNIPVVGVTESCLII